MLLSSTCPCSDQYFKYLNDLSKKYPDNFYMGFNSKKESTLEEAKKYFDKYKINFPVILDSNLKYADKFNALKTPHVFVVDKKGKLLYHGGVANSRSMKKAKNFYLADALEDIKNGKQPRREYARTIGCYISR